MLYISYTFKYYVIQTFANPNFSYMHIAFLRREKKSKKDFIRNIVKIQKEQSTNARKVSVMLNFCRREIEDKSEFNRYTGKIKTEDLAM